MLVPNMRHNLAFINPKLGRYQQLLSGSRSSKQSPNVDSSADDSRPEWVKHIANLPIFSYNIDKLFGGNPISPLWMARMSELIGLVSPFEFHDLYHNLIVSSVIGTYGSVAQKERYLSAAVEHRVRFQLLVREVCSLLEPLAPSSLPADANPTVSAAPSGETASRDSRQHPTPSPTGVFSPTLVATVQPGASAVHGPFVLSGQKMCVASHVDSEKQSPNAETVLLVAARRRLDEYKDTYSGKRGQTDLLWFLLPASTPGIRTHVAPSKHGTNYLIYTFDNVTLGSEHLFPVTSEQALKVLLQAEHNFRFLQGSFVVGLLRHFFKVYTKLAESVQFLGKPLLEHENVQEMLSLAMSRCYALESSVYLTAGFANSFPRAELGMEGALVQMLALDVLYSVIQDFGRVSYLHPLRLPSTASNSFASKHVAEPLLFHEYLQLLQEHAATLAFNDGGLDVLRHHVALAGTQYAVTVFEEHIRRKRNPFYEFEDWIYQSMTKNERHFLLRGKQKQLLREHVHPLLSRAAGRVGRLAPWHEGGPAETLESQLLDFRGAVNQTLIYYGDEIKERHGAHRRMADVAMLLYSQVACIARCSRSLSIGLQHAEHEVDLVELYRRQSKWRVKQLLGENELSINPQAGKRIRWWDFLSIGYGLYVREPDTIYERVARRVYKAQQYAAEHPLRRTW